MWLITSSGFYSIVCKPGDAERGELTIRSRVRSDLEALSSQLSSISAIEEGGGTDYRFRMRAKRDDIVAALGDMVRELNYENFKNEVARKQGHERAHVYHGVWDVLYGLQGNAVHSLDKAFGGVVVDDQGRVLLCCPTSEFDGYVWTFPKGRPEPWESAEAAAIREVLEETGYEVEIKSRIPGSYIGSTTETEYFLMTPIAKASTPDAAETESTHWASFEEAHELLSQTINEAGRLRDLRVLAAAKSVLREIKG